MLNKILTTPVDDLVELVKSNPDCSVTFIQGKLGLPVEIIEKWLVVLEEYKVVKVNYKGFEGYVKYLVSQKEEDAKKQKAKQIDISRLKDAFVEKSQKRGLSSEQMSSLWPQFVLNFERDIREMFYNMAREKGYETVKIATAWNKYKEELVKF